MVKFIETYSDLYKISMEKIDQELAIIMEYLCLNFNRFDNNNIDI